MNFSQFVAFLIHDKTGHNFTSVWILILYCACLQRQRVTPQRQLRQCQLATWSDIIHVLSSSNCSFSGQPPTQTSSSMSSAGKNRIRYAPVWPVFESVAYQSNWSARSCQIFKLFSIEHDNKKGNIAVCGKTVLKFCSYLGCVNVIWAQLSFC